MKQTNLPALTLAGCLVLTLPIPGQAMTWAELGRQNQPPQPVFTTPQPQAPRFWPKRQHKGWMPWEQQPPTPLLYWSQYQAGLYDNPWTLGWLDGWWAPPVHWGTPLAPWTQQQLYQWWNTQVFHADSPPTHQP